MKDKIKLTPPSFAPSVAPSAMYRGVSAFILIDTVRYPSTHDIRSGQAISAHPEQAEGASNGRERVFVLSFS